MSDQLPEELPELKAFEVRAENLLATVFGGMHHVERLKKYPRYWTCVQSGDFATYDFDTLTRLVFAAHDNCCRVSIGNGGPYRMKIMVFDRKRTGGISERHPTVEQALADWRF